MFYQAFALRWLIYWPEMRYGHAKIDLTDILTNNYLVVISLHAVPIVLYTYIVSN